MLKRVLQNIVDSTWVDKSQICNMKRRQNSEMEEKKAKAYKIQNTSIILAVLVLIQKWSSISNIN